MTVSAPVADALPLALLPGLGVRAESDGEASVGTSERAEVWLDPGRPVCAAQARAEGWSIGWRWHASQRFAPQSVQHWLAGLPWRRAKLVLHTEAGWLSGNALNGEPIRWQPSEWRRDSRLELIFAEAGDEAALQAGMAACRLPG